MNFVSFVKSPGIERTWPIAEALSLHNSFNKDNWERIREYKGLIYNTEKEDDWIQSSEGYEERKDDYCEYEGNM